MMFICPDLDPSRVCKGKGVVTLRATLVHIDDEDCVSAGPDVTDTPSKCELREGGAHLLCKTLSK